MELPLDHPQVKAVIRELLFHPKFSAFLEDYSETDQLVNTVYDKLIEIAFPGCTREQVKRLKEQYSMMELSTEITRGSSKKQVVLV